MKIRKSYEVATFIIITGIVCGQAWAQGMRAGAGPPQGNGSGQSYEWNHGDGGNSDQSLRGRSRLYPSFTVDTEGDIFTSPERFEERTGLRWVDDNGDGVNDYVQNTEQHRNELRFQWRDSNHDGISDHFQTRQAYRWMEMNNYVDVDGDGLCDNYEDRPWDSNATDNFRRRLGPQYYPEAEVNTAREIFVNQELFEERTGRQWIDENGDGISDHAQDTVYFEELGIGPWADSNNDTIADVIQTRPMYWALGMGSNFIDVNGDGLCDNYVEDPDPVSGDEQ